MQREISMPLVIAILVIVVIGIGFFAWRQAVPHAPAGARPAREGIRDSLSKQLGRPIGNRYNPRGPD